MATDSLDPDRIAEFCAGFFGVQTPQEATEGTAPWWESWPEPFAVLVRRRGGRGDKRDLMVRVVRPDSDRHGELLVAGLTEEGRTLYYSRGAWVVDLGAIPIAVEGRPCKCGCGLPCPVGQAYADTDFCRKREYVYFRPQIDLRGMDRPGAERAMALVGEAIRAAKLGQRRATVDVRPVEHKSERKADTRPSNRIRLSPSEWEALQEVRSFWAEDCPTATVRRLIQQEKERIEALKKQEESHG